MTVQLRDPAVVHVRFDGRSLDVALAHLHLRADARDDQVLQALAGYLEVPEDRLNDYVLDRHANGNLTVRPQAVFG